MGVGWESFFSGMWEVAEQSLATLKLDLREIGRRRNEVSLKVGDKKFEVMQTAC